MLHVSILIFYAGLQSKFPNSGDLESAFSVARRHHLSQMDRSHVRQQLPVEVLAHVASFSGQVLCYELYHHWDQKRFAMICEDVSNSEKRGLKRKHYLK